jgi:hypothetical protein
MNETESKQQADSFDRELPESITIIGRRWFEKTNGNTYNRVDIYIDQEKIHKTDFEYGYGNHYADIAAKWLYEHGHMPGRDMRGPGQSPEALWTYCRRVGIKLLDQVIDVARKKDL